MLSKNNKVNERFSEILRNIVDVTIVENLCGNENENYDYVFVNASIFHFQNFQLKGSHVHSVLEHLQEHFSESKIIVFAKKELIDEMAIIVKSGVSDYLTLPIIRDELLLLTEDIKRIAIEEEGFDYLTGHFWDKTFKSQMNTQSKIMKDVYLKVRQVSEKSANVLLTGETGVGKNVIANLIHCHSDRRSKPFVSVHCGAIPESLLESELFGHEKGSFTGAIKRKLGKFELANGGTIFLDEIGTMTMSAQIKLLQVIQDSTFQRVGGEVDIKLDIRIIAATNIDISDHIERGSFREDLFYRINVFPITIPALRNRKEDIPNLLSVFLKRYNDLYHSSIQDFSTDVLYAAKNYDWPGNIRELENLVERACIMESSDTLSMSSFPILDRTSNENHYDGEEAIALPLMTARQIIIDKFEKGYFEERLLENKGKIREVSKAAGIGARQTHKLLAKYDLQAGDYRKK